MPERNLATKVEFDLFKLILKLEYASVFGLNLQKIILDHISCIEEGKSISIDLQGIWCECENKEN